MSQKERMHEKDLLFAFRYGSPLDKDALMTIRDKTKPIPRWVLALLNLDDTLTEVVQDYNDILLDYGQMLYDLGKQVRELTQLIKCSWVSPEFRLECRECRRDVRTQIIKVRGHVKGVQKNIQEIRYRFHFHKPC